MARWKQASRREIARRMRESTHLSHSEIGRQLGVSRETARQASIGVPIPHKKLSYTASFIARKKPRIGRPEKLIEFMERNADLPRKTLADYLGVSESSVDNLRKNLGIDRSLSNINRLRRERVLRDAERMKRAGPGSLAFGRLFKTRKGREFLSRILTAFAEHPGEPSTDTMLVFERFLKSAGLSRKAVGMSERNETLGGVKAKLEKRVTGVTMLKDLVYPDGKTAKNKPEGVIGHRPIVNSAIEELVAEGKLVRVKWRNHGYVFRPGQLAEFEAMQKRAIEQQRQDKQARERQRYHERKKSGKNRK